MKGRARQTLLIYGSRTIFDIHFRRCGQLEKQPTNSRTLTLAECRLSLCVCVCVRMRLCVCEGIRASDLF